MRTLERNQQRMFYALYDKKEAVIDEYGNKTGEWDLAYGEKIEISGTVTSATGFAQPELFGIFDSYDKVVILDNPDLPIKSSTIFWIDDLEAEKHDYKVVKPARSLNSLAVAVSKIAVNE